MTTIHTSTIKPASLTHALLFYTQGAANGNAIGELQHATLHTVQDGVIQPSTLPLTTHALQALNTSLQELNEQTQGRAVMQILPTKVLFRDAANAITIWWRQGSPTPQFFNCKELGQIQGVTSMPSLVFAQNGTKLSVCAVAGNERPTNETPVFHAPVFNTYADGDVCLGGIVLKPIGDIEELEASQDKFLRGINTHPNGQHRKTLYENGIFALWRDLIADPAKGWQDDWLSPMDSTLGEWMTEVCE